MAHSATPCSNPHCHHRCHHDPCKHYAHNLYIHAHGHKHRCNYKHHRHSCHGCEKSHQASVCNSQSETTLNESDPTETSTLRTSTSEQPKSTYQTTSTTCYAKSSAFCLRHEVPSLHVSVNLRLSGTNTVLLAEDVFVPTAGSESLKSIFEAAQIRYPHLVGRYILRQEKDVVVLCHDERKNTYATTTMVFAALSRLRPIRLIFCVVPNVEVIRELDSQKTYRLKVNVRTESNHECILERDTVVEARGNISAQQLWKTLIKRHPQIQNLAASGVLTRRPEDSVVVRFGMYDFVADLVKSGGRQFVFVISDHHIHEHHQHTDGVTARQCQHRKSNLDDRMRFKLGFRLRHDVCNHWWRVFEWGLREKK